MKNFHTDAFAFIAVGIISLALISVLLIGCAGTTTPIGTASARQQTLSISLTVEGPLPAGSTEPLISIGTVTYDGTRGDVAKNKASDGSSIQDDDTITIPLAQAAPGATIAKSVWDRVVARAKADKTETVPAIFGNMSLEKWKELKASYIECPECLALTPEEEAALKAATGK